MWRLSMCALAVCVSAGAQHRSSDYAVGADLSFLKQVEDRGTVFRDGGKPKPGLEIFRDHGYNWIRLRIFHTPPQLPNNLAYTTKLAQDARKLGFKFLLDFHYSDTWADPGKQYLPKVWESLTHPELVKAVFEYTRDTLTSLGQAGVMPDMVQIGNEVDNGILWPDGKLPGNWDQFADLVQAGITGVHAAAGTRPRPRIMIHIAKGGEKAQTKRFFDRLLSYGVEFDVIGQSYYPWWHGTLLDLRENLHFMAKEYEKDIILVEVAYNCRPAEYAKKGKPGPWPETPEGQKEFLEEVQRIALGAPDNRGKGIFWWEPAVVGPLERRGLFDENRNALPAIAVFDKYTRQ